MIEAFYAEYERFVRECDDVVDLSDPCKRPSIIAHSFGTFLVGYAMLKYEYMRYDKMILCGSILPRDFDWRLLLTRDQVNIVRNEYGLRDVWTKTAPWLVGNTGDSGARGFTFVGAGFEQRDFSLHKHSDFFSRGHMSKYWLPLLEREISNLTIIHGRGLDRERLIEFMSITAEIDEICYGKTLGINEARVSIELGAEWIDINPDIYTFLVDRTTQKPVGYINAMPVTAEVFERIKTRGIRDNEVKASDVLPFDPEEAVNLYCMSIAIHPEARRRSEGLFNEACEKLLNGFCVKLKDYGVQQETTIGEMAGIGWTPEGERLCASLGMSKIACDEFGHPVYHVNMEAPPQRRTYRCVRNLIDWYRDRE